MSKIIIHEFMTLDGVIQAPGGKEEDTDGGFEYGGWTNPYWHDDIGVQFFQVMKDADTLLLGRKTWEIHGNAFEPMPAGNPFGDILNAVQKIVVSTTLKSVKAWRNSTQIKDDVIDEIRKLKRKSGKNILMDGSSVLAHTLIENDLIDEFSLHMYPLVLGKGKRLFPEGKRVNIQLMKSKTLPTGVVYQEYQVVKR